MSDGRRVLLGRISGLYGVRGWVRVFSYTEPREGILRYRPWLLSSGDGDWEPWVVAEGRRHGPTVIARLEGVEDRDAAGALLGRDIAIPAEALPEKAPGEYYWAELIGLEVINEAGVRLGRVARLLETGAHDVLVLEAPDRERLVPFVEGDVVRAVDLDAGRIVVDWEPDY
ncbi:MAG TPA: ribosome maturation factor RimM [Chromatiales bacterium]|nr:ribosome maturation factor RimM [Chromatiales bacterium]